jgi:hypothetical protein
LWFKSCVTVAEMACHGCVCVYVREGERAGGFAQGFVRL